MLAQLRRRLEELVEESVRRAPLYRLIGRDSCGMEMLPESTLVSPLRDAVVLRLGDILSVSVADGTREAVGGAVDLDLQEDGDEEEEAINQCLAN